jgi:hypothetical protein
MTLPKNSLKNNTVSVVWTDAKKML